MARAAPIDPMAEAHERWCRSSGARWQDFDKARRAAEQLLNEVESLLTRFANDPELSQHPNPARVPHRKVTFGKARIQGRLDHEALARNAVQRVRERLYHPDLDLDGMISCIDLLILVSNAMGGRLEVPARRGNRAAQFSRAGGQAKKVNALAKRAKDEEALRAAVAAAKKQNPALIRARSLAAVVAPKLGISAEHVRKQISALGLAQRRSPKKKLGRLGG